MKIEFNGLCSSLGSVVKLLASLLKIRVGIEGYDLKSSECITIARMIC